MPHATSASQVAGHPLDLQRRRVPPDATVCPLPQHPSPWGMFIFPAGTKTVGTGHGATQDFSPGDIVLPPPGTVHLVGNTGGTDAFIADPTRPTAPTTPTPTRGSSSPRAKSSA